MNETMIEIAKRKDNGTLAKYGMMSYLANWFNMDINAECINYIVETYLECIDNIEFQSWVSGGYNNGQPMIFSRNYLKSHYSDLMNYTNDLNIISDWFMCLSGQEFFVDEISDCIYSTSYTPIHNRKKLNYIGIAMEYERLCALCGREVLEKWDIDTIIECLNEYAYDINSDNNCYSDDIYEYAQNILERLHEVFLI